MDVEGNFIWRNAHIPFLGEVSNALIARCFKIENDKLIPILTEKPLLNENVIKLISCNCKFGFKNKQCASRKAALKCSVLCHARGK